MLKKTLALLAVALLCTAAAAPKSTKPGAAKPAARAPAAKSAAKPSGSFDAQDPNSLVGLLTGLDAKAQVVRREGDAVFLAVTSPTENFSAQFAGCNAQGRACQAVLLDQLGTIGAPTVAQINGFNQTSVMCRVYQDRAGKAHVEYSALLFPRNTREEMLMHLNAWRGCLGDFHEFATDPTAFLAGAA